MAALRIKGGPELKARLAAVVAARPEITRAWSEDAAKRIRADAPRRTGHLANSIAPGEQRGKGVVKGAWYGIILDRGTRSYGIAPRNASVLRFEYKGRTIFAKKAQRRRLRRRPFITKNAQAALTALPMRDEIIQAWNRRRSSGRFTKF